MSDWVAVAYTTLGCISMLSGFFLLIVYLFWKKLRRNPGMLIFWHILSQTMLDFYFFYSGTYCLKTGHFPDEYCEITGVFNIYFYFLGFAYALSLCVEVLLRLKFPMDMRYRKRSKIYHILSHSSAFLISLSMAAGRQAGPSSNHLCMIRLSSDYTYIMMFPLLSLLPALVITLYITCNLKRSASLVNYFLIKHSVYVTAYFLIWFPVALNIILEKEKLQTDQNRFSRFTVVLSSSAGVIMSVIRLSSHSLIKYVRHRNKARRTHRFSVATLLADVIKARSPSSKNIDLSDPFDTDYAKAFTSVSTESAFSAILVLNISLLYTPEIPAGKPPWPDGYYSNYLCSVISPVELGQVYLMPFIKAYCKI